MPPRPPSNPPEPPATRVGAPPSTPPGAAPDAEEAADRRLVGAIQGGDRSAWSGLLSRHQDRVYTICLRMVGNRDTAADLTQDVMVKVIQGLDGYDGRSKFTTWLTRVAMNACLSHRRSQRLRRHASLNGTPQTGGADDSHAGDGIADAASYRTSSGGQFTEQTPESGVQSSERRGRLLAALAAIPADQRAILVLRDVQGLDYDAIAEVLDIAVGTVKSRLFRARAALREAIESSGASRAASPADPETDSEL